MQKRAGDRDALLLASRQLSRVLAGLLRDLDALQVPHRDGGRLRSWQLADLYRRKHAIFENRHVRKEVEMLKHHADLSPHFIDALDVAGQLDPVDDEPAFFMLLEPIDTPDHGGLAGARRTADDDTLALHHFQIDVLQRMEAPEPLVDMDHLDRDAGYRALHRWSVQWYRRRKTQV